jgi:HlyD family secretion protein
VQTRNTLLIGLVGLLAVALGAWWWLAHRPQPTDQWQGYADADYVRVAPPQAGTLTAVDVARGDAVAKGAPLFTLDDAAERAARDQAASQLGEAETQLANLKAAAKQTEVDQAAANLAAARLAEEQANTDYRRGQTLLASATITKQTLDQLATTYQSAVQKTAAAEAALAEAQGPIGRTGEIATQQAAVNAAKAALSAAEYRLGQRGVAAPVTARVADVLARPGETVAASAPVISLLPPGNLFVRFFVPEPILPRLHLGDPVGLACDGCPGDLTGTIAFISPQAEYTPPVIYSESSRAKLVYVIEARPPPAQATAINPGEPVVVRLGPAGARP